MTPLRPGHHLYPAPDGWRCALPGDRYVRIGGPDEALRAFQPTAHGHTGSATADVGALRDAFAAHDLLAEPVATGPAPRVLITGDGPVADALAAVLSGWTPRRAGRADALRDLDVLVDCAGWLPDARWQALDAACAAADVAWHRCHAEGTSLLTGPLTVPGRSPGWTDLRGRRLAASGVADELVHHWAWLDSGTGTPPVPDPGPGIAAVVAGLLADEIATWWRTGVAGPVGYQTEVSTNPLRVTRHPVLTLPTLAAATP